MKIRSFLCLAFLATAGFAMAADEGVYTKVDQAPVPVKTPPPNYPPEMRRDQIEGIVAVAAIVDETGAVVKTEVTKASRDEFVAAAINAVKSWHFRPGLKDGVAVKVRVVIPIHFNFS